MPAGPCPVLPTGGLLPPCVAPGHNAARWPFLIANLPGWRLERPCLPWTHTVPHLLLRTLPHRLHHPAAFWFFSVTPYHAPPAYLVPTQVRSGLFTTVHCRTCPTALLTSTCGCRHCLTAVAHTTRRYPPPPTCTTPFHYHPPHPTPPSRTAATRANHRCAPPNRTTPALPTHLQPRTTWLRPPRWTVALDGCQNCTRDRLLVRLHLSNRDTDIQRAIPS